MVTAWPPSGLLRVRSAAGPLRLLWLAALVLTVLFTHGVSVESAEGHVTAGVVASAQASAASHGSLPREGVDSDDVTSASHQATGDKGSHEGDAFSHPGQECVSGQPQQGPDMAAPGLAPLDWATPLTHDDTVGTFGPFRPGVTVPPLLGSRGSVVQQV